MDEKTKLLVCLTAATAANCIPCFDFYYQKAQACGLAAANVQEAVECAYKIREHQYADEKQHPELHGPGRGDLPPARR